MYNYNNFHNILNTSLHNWLRSAAAVVHACMHRRIKLEKCVAIKMSSCMITQESKAMFFNVFFTSHKKVN